MKYQPKDEGTIDGWSSEVEITVPTEVDIVVLVSGLHLATLLAAKYKTMCRKVSCEFSLLKVILNH